MNTKQTYRSLADGDDDEHQYSGYPVLVMDKPLLNYTGSILPLYFTAFSSSPYVTVYVMIDTSLLAQTYNVYFVNYAWNISLEGIESGKHLLNITVVDSGGRNKSITHVFVFDSAPPILHAVLSATEVLYNESVILSWNVTDDSFDRIEVYLDEDEQPRLTSQQSLGSYYLKQPSNTYMAEGVHYVRIVAYDKAGNYQEQVLTFSITIPSEAKLIYNQAYVDSLVSYYEEQLGSYDKRFMKDFLWGSFVVLLITLIGYWRGAKIGKTIVEKLKIGRVL